MIMGEELGTAVAPIRGDEIVIYEYVVVSADWFGSLERGTRFYYDHDKQAYYYHYEVSGSEQGPRYTNTHFRSEDYVVSVKSVNEYIASEVLKPGPVLGALSFGGGDEKLS